MEENKNTEKKELSYEELKNIASQLSAQNEQLRGALMDANQDNIIARITLLFKVLDLKASFNETFIQEVVDELEGLLRRPKEENKE